MMHGPGFSVLRPAALARLLLLSALLAGCSETKPEAARRPLEGVVLRLVVADDPALAAAIASVRGEWNAQTGSTLQVGEITAKNLEQAESLPADVAICPSHLVGVLAERNWLAPTPASILQGTQWGEIFDLAKLGEAAWGRSTVAVPFGSPTFCCYYRADLLKKLGRRPPRTWEEYRELAALLAVNCPQSQAHGNTAKKTLWCGAIEPLAPGWAGLTFLARAAPYAKHRSSDSTLFDVETMAPLIAEPPFVRAMEELAAAARLGPADPFGVDPMAARAAFWRGECGLALTWPTRSAAVPTGGDISAGFAELPGTQQVFNRGGRRWERRSDDEDTRVPLLAIAGRLGVVGAKSPQRGAAFQLLMWLSDSRMRSQVSAASPATTLFSQADLKTPANWVEKAASASAAAQYGEATLAAFRHEQWIDALRLPGRAEYLSALDAAVAAVVRGEKSASDALHGAATQWEAITKRLGPERQRAAYRHALGLE